MKALLLTFLLICTCVTLPAQAVFTGFKDLPVPKSPTKVQISKALDELKKLKAGEPYQEWPSAEEPFEAGSLNLAFMKQGLETHKFYRLIAGLNTNVKINTSWNEIAQHAAVVLYARGFQTHTPEYPEGKGMEREFYNKGYKGASSSNLGMTERNLAEFINACINDSDETNIASVGHRRWHLFPSLDEVGFGYFEQFAATRVFDLDKRPTPSEIAYVAYPPAGFMPLEAFHTKLAWHFEVYDLPQFGGLTAKKSDLAVTVKRQSDGRTWTFSMAKSDGFFNITSPSIGSGYTLIFRPDNLGFVADNELFDVSIAGLTNAKAKPIDVKYTTQFFSSQPDSQPKVVSQKPKEPSLFGTFTEAGIKKQVSGKKIEIGNGKETLTNFSLWIDTIDGLVPCTFYINGKPIAPGEVFSGKSGVNTFAVKGNRAGVKLWVNLYSAAIGYLPEQYYDGYTASLSKGQAATKIEVTLIDGAWYKTLLGE